jgi:hypothetical protein
LFDIIYPFDWIIRPQCAFLNLYNYCFILLKHISCLVGTLAHSPEIPLLEGKVHLVSICIKVILAVSASVSDALEYMRYNRCSSHSHRSDKAISIVPTRRSRCDCWMCVGNRRYLVQSITYVPSDWLQLIHVGETSTNFPFVSSLLNVFLQQKWECGIRVFSKAEKIDQIVYLTDMFGLLNELSIFLQGPIEVSSVCMQF